ncbi:hypothetical protein [Natribacillus halophilus]|uniref:Uncharacterized protein n=1 Tax=Natribacillus halophilus TaxID=549003 RepID=A0A1G8QQT5_9BACI|nr:hypothetical protein [Natribacillus halophilus]SDJ07023.1 hypothetical protein SAMN04488123_11355 [Natribacillus halophilus]
MPTVNGLSLQENMKLYFSQMEMDVEKVSATFEVLESSETAP